MSQLKEFVQVFQRELIDDKIDEHTDYKNHSSWSSLVSLIIITEIEKCFDVLIEVEHLRNTTTITDLYKQCMQTTK
ncbi:hypothetical protein [Marinoscillum sp.]|uniref:hypothetical protein n=1 Tax=Marinoscillum sp. TaxID=2024838 RepID=UPI003BAAD4A1